MIIGRTRIIWYNISTSLSDKEKLDKEYQEALNSGDKDRIIIILQRKMEYYELYINNLNLLIQHLRNDIHKKEKIMHLLTDTNTQLKNALNNYVKTYNYEVIDFKYIGGVHKVGYFIEEDTPYYDGIQLNVKKKEKTLARK